LEIGRDHSDEVRRAANAERYLIEGPSPRLSHFAEIVARLANGEEMN